MQTANRSDIFEVMHIIQQVDFFCNTLQETYFARKLRIGDNTAEIVRKTRFVMLNYAYAKNLTGCIKRLLKSFDTPFSVISILLLVSHKIFPIRLAVLNMGERLTETLEMHNFPCPQEFDHIVYICVVANAQYVVICSACFLFCS